MFFKFKPLAYTFDLKFVLWVIKDIAGFIFGYD